jgi:hypothetical protein
LVRGCGVVWSIISPSHGEDPSSNLGNRITFSTAGADGLAENFVFKNLGNRIF